MPFQKIAAEKMARAVVRQIEGLVLRGVLRPGDRLPPERELASRLDVSRPTLREALADLEARWLIESRPGGGTFVSDVMGSAFTPPLIELFATHDAVLFDYIAFRRDVEALAAERAALAATEADLEVVCSVFDRLEAASEAGDRDRAAALDAEFHLAVVESAHNLMMMHVMRSLSSLLVRGVFYNRDAVYSLEKGRGQLLEQHREIRDAVVGRRPAAARAAVEAHLDFVAEAVRTAERVRSREEISELRRRHEANRAARSRVRRPPPRRGMEAAE